MVDPRKISLACLSFTSVAGLLRGYRMILYQGTNGLILPYSGNTIQDTIFSNYTLFGIIFLILVPGVSMLSLYLFLARKRYAPYFMMAEGVFVTFLTMTYLLYNGYSWPILLVLPFCILVIVLGVIQTPREF